MTPLRIDDIITTYTKTKLCAYSQLSLKSDPIYHDITQSIASIATEHKADLKLTKDTPYRALAGELWGVYCENLGGN